jgi:hypothetical protein
MDTRKSQTKIQPNPTGNVNISKLEERLERLENVSHKPCGGTSQVVKFDLSDLPQLPNKKTTSLEKRVSAIEDKLEELIKRLEK